MPSYRPQTKIISASSCISGYIVNKNFDFSIMFIQRSSPLSINIELSGVTRVVPIIYANEGVSSVDLNAKINKI